MLKEPNTELLKYVPPAEAYNVFFTTTHSTKLNFGY